MFCLPTEPLLFLPCTLSQQMDLPSIRLLRPEMENLPVFFPLTYHHPFHLFCPFHFFVFFISIHFSQFPWPLVEFVFLFLLVLCPSHSSYCHQSDCCKIQKPHHYLKPCDNSSLSFTSNPKSSQDSPWPGSSLGFWLHLSANLFLHYICTELVSVD